MKNNIEEIIKIFGKRLIKVSRDYTISIVLSELKDQRLPIVIQKIIGSFSEEQCKAMIYLLISAVDKTFHDTLWSIESYPEYKIIVNNDNEIIDIDDSLNELIGAGLTGAALEFIDEYSKYNTADDFLETGKLEKEPIDK